MKTRGVNPDQLVAAIEATSHAMNIIALNAERKGKGKAGRRIKPPPVNA